MRHLGSRFPRRASSAALLLALALGAGGCLMRQSTHDRVVGQLEEERMRLESELEKAQASNSALSLERVRLLDDMEDLRLERESLAGDVSQLARTRDLLTEHLQRREQEVEELSKLSGQYEQLVTDLEAEVASGQIQITQLREGLRLNLSQDILFRSGSTTLETYGVGDPAQGGRPADRVRSERGGPGAHRRRAPVFGPGAALGQQLGAGRGAGLPGGAPLRGRGRGPLPAAGGLLRLPTRRSRTTTAPRAALRTGVSSCA